MYIVKYSKGTWNSYPIIIFITNKKSTAIKYVTKFNALLEKWSEYYSQFEDENNWIKDEYVEQHFFRWYTLKKINECYYEEIKVR